MSNQSNIFGKPLVWESVFTNVFRNIFEMNRSAYSVLGFEPGLVLDFDDDYYRIGDFQRPFSTAITHTRASTATYVDADGVLQTAASGVPRIGHHVYNGSAWVNEGLLHESEARTNLLLNSGTLSTQSVTVTAAAHTLHFTGTGTITLSGVSTDGPLVGTGTGENNRVYLTFTPTAGTLTLTVTGTVSNAQLEVGPTPSSYIPTSGATATRAAETLTIPAANLPWPSPVVIGPELVTNGTFDTDVNGWNVTNAVIYWDAAGYLVVDDTANAGGDSRAFQDFATTAGRLYEISFDRISTTSTFWFAIGTPANYQSIFYSNSLGTTTGRYSRTFVASGSTTRISMITASVGVTKYDNISVREINPLAVSIQMDGRVTYADKNNFDTVIFSNWIEDANNLLRIRLDTDGARTGRFAVRQIESGNATTVGPIGDVYSPDILVSYNVAGRFGSNFLNGGYDGNIFTASTTPTALPDLSAIDLLLGSVYNGTIRTFRVWSEDITDAGLEEATT